MPGLRARVAVGFNILMWDRFIVLVRVRKRLLVVFAGRTLSAA
jgi:hypothetical protein